VSSLVTPDEALRLLATGVVVAVPTDTVYGLAASLDSPDAVAALFSIKRRPTSVALPVMVPDVAAIKDLGATWSPDAAVLARAFWPGALTIVVAAPSALARRVGATSDAVGFRVPGNDALRALLGTSGPLCVTSANEHGEPPCRLAEEVLARLGRDPLLGGVLDGGRCDGAVSTVVDVRETDWRVLRAGAVSDAALDAARRGA